MAITRVISVNANTGAYTPIDAIVPARSVSIVEDASVTAQGLHAQFPSDGYTTTAAFAAGATITLVGAGHDGVCGLPEQNAANGAGAFNHRDADVYCQLRSATATPTVVRVTESESTI